MSSLSTRSTIECSDLRALARAVLFPLPRSMLVFAGRPAISSRSPARSTYPPGRHRRVVATAGYSQPAPFALHSLIRGRPAIQRRARMQDRGAATQYQARRTARTPGLDRLDGDCARAALSRPSSVSQNELTTHRSIGEGATHEYQSPQQLMALLAQCLFRLRQGDLCGSRCSRLLGRSGLPRPSPLQNAKHALRDGQPPGRTGQGCMVSSLAPDRVSLLPHRTARQSWLCEEHYRRVRTPMLPIAAMDRGCDGLSPLGTAPARTRSALARCASPTAVVRWTLSRAALRVWRHCLTRLRHPRHRFPGGPSPSQLPGPDRVRNATGRPPACEAAALRARQPSRAMYPRSSRSNVRSCCGRRLG